MQVVKRRSSAAQDTVSVWVYRELVEVKMAEFLLPLHWNCYLIAVRLVGVRMHLFYCVYVVVVVRLCYYWNLQCS